MPETCGEFNNQGFLNRESEMIDDTKQTSPKSKISAVSTRQVDLLDHAECPKHQAAGAVPRSAQRAKDEGQIVGVG